MMGSSNQTTSEPAGGGGGGGSTETTQKPIGRFKTDGIGRGGSDDSAKAKWMLERLTEPVPDEVALFTQFEELSKIYILEAPYVARSQVELVFDVFDGRKLQQAGLMEEAEEGPEEAEEDPEGPTTGRGSQRVSLDRTATSSGGAKSLHRLAAKRHNHFSLSKLLPFSSRRRRNPSSSMRCCLSKSDTSQELASSLSVSSSSVGLQTAALATAHSPALARQPDDDQEDLELKEEAQRIIGPLLNQLKRRSSLLASANSPAERFSSGDCVGLQQQVILEPEAGFGNESGGLQSVSVCLFDKRGRLVRLKLEAENGRRRAQAEARLEELASRCHRATSPKQMEAIWRQMDQANPSLSSLDCTESERLTGGQLAKLIDLTKNSLNHLIDAQLLLRNKLTSEQEQIQQQQHLLQQQPQQSRIGICMEYDALLKNNFNLLKVWQNLEETKRLVCFVCEPIKCNLSDLFWFSRQRPREFGCHSASPGDQLLVSPLVSLDSIEVKRGLLQILEALNYLHSICKLIHRNLTPRNILVVANGNWKLGGLEFAIRFESATISQSASIMANEPGSGLLLSRCGSSASGTRPAFRRQKTLTKCDEFIRRPKSGVRVIQPEVDYLAPEIWKSAQCSHKSDMFAYGLVLGQTYDLCRHKPPISCRANAQNYDSELKKLRERRRRKLGRLVPFEMRSALFEMLELEPNMRPSANYALQLFRRPIELCKRNEDSLRHLRSSLGYLDRSHSWINNNNNNINTAHKKRINYFRKVTSVADHSAARGGQSRNLHLLNLLVRGVDSLAKTNTASLGFSSPLDPEQLQRPQQLIFHQLKQQFECTFASLKQLYDSTALRNSDTFICADSRSLMLVVALHRRLLEQVGQMRNELPPVCRLAGPTTQTNRLTQNHRALAELENRLHCLISRHSVAKLAPVLTDPLLKLEEFLLVFELVNDLLAFLGQKCRQNFTQRAKQLLNELTPVTGCPSLSSSDDDDDSAHSDSFQRALINSRGLAGAGSRQTLGSRETLNNFCINNNTTNNLVNSNNSIKSMMSHRFSAYDDSATTARRQTRHFLNQPTKISITAPSPMGSMRDMSRLTNESPPITFDQMQSASRVQQQQQQEDLQLTEIASQMSSKCAISYSGPDGEETEMQVANGETNEQNDPNQEGGSKSRSQLIDELLKTINDDSFNDLVDFNNKFASAAGNQQQQQQQQLTPAQLASLNRPKSAIDGLQNKSQGSPSPQGHRPSSLALNNKHQNRAAGASPSAFDNVIRRMSTNIVQNFNKMSNNTSANDTQHQQQESSSTALRREKSSNPSNSLYVDNQVPVRRHSDNTINVPRIQVALSSPQASRTGLNQRASVSASKLANKWKLSAMTNNRRESNDNKLSPNLGGALGYMRRHSSGNTTGNNDSQSQSNGQTSNLLLNASSFKTKSSSNLGLDFLLSNRSMKRRCSAASMLGHQTQRKAEDLIDAGMKSVFKQDPAAAIGSFSKNLLGLKFMQRAKKEVEKDESFDLSLCKDMKSKQQFIINPSYQFCERLKFGRLSFKERDASTSEKRGPPPSDSESDDCHGYSDCSED